MYCTVCISFQHSIKLIAAEAASTTNDLHREETDFAADAV
jgi:hypothetical protein